MFKKMKSTPGGAPINHQIDNNTPAIKSHAEFLFDMIGTGRERALKRPSGRADRHLRKLIAAANISGDCIINIGDGYFRPGKDDEDALRQYLSIEKHRGHEILYKAYCMERSYNERYKEAR